MSFSDLSSINESRRQALAATIEPATMEELRALGERLFPFLDHPWRQQYFAFLDENQDNSYFKAATDDGFGVIYCREQNRGIWFIPSVGTGPLQESGLKVLAEITKQKS